MPLSPQFNEQNFLQNQSGFFGVPGTPLYSANGPRQFAREGFGPGQQPPPPPSEPVPDPTSPGREWTGRYSTVGLPIFGSLPDNSGAYAPIGYPEQGGNSGAGQQQGGMFGMPQTPMPQTPMMQNQFGGGFDSGGFFAFLSQLIAQMQQQGQQQPRRVDSGGGMVQGDNSFMNRLFY